MCLVFTSLTDMVLINNRQDNLCNATTSRFYNLLLIARKNNLMFVYSSVLNFKTPGLIAYES